MQRVIDRYGRIAVFATALVAAIALASAVAQMAAGYRGIGDFGAIAVRSLDVGTANTPLLGTRSSVAPDASIGIMHHPGPMQFFVLAPWVRLLGDHGLPLAGAFTTIVAALLLVWVCQRAWGRDGATVAALGTLTMVLSMGVADSVSVWPPVAIILPLASVWIATWLVITGDSAGWWVLIAAGSFVSQSNLAAAPNVAIALGAAAVASAIRRRPLRPVLGPALLGLALWIPPIIEQFTDDHPNLNAIWHSSQAPADTVGWARSIKTVGVLLSSPAGWAGVPYDRPWVPGASFAFEPPHLLPARPLLAVGLLVVLTAAVGALLTRRRGALLGVGACVSLASLAIAEFARAPFAYSIVSAGWMRWMWSVSLVIWIVVGIQLLKLAKAMFPRSPQAAVAAGAIVAAAVLVPIPHAIAEIDNQLDVTHATAAAVNRLESASLRATRSMPAVLIESDPVASGVLPVLIMANEAAGTTVYTAFVGLGDNAPKAAIFGDERSMDIPKGVDRNSIPVLTVASVPNLDISFGREGATIVGSSFGSAADASELDRLNASQSLSVADRARRDQLRNSAKRAEGVPIVLFLRAPKTAG